MKVHGDVYLGFRVSKKEGPLFGVLYVALNLKPYEVSSQAYRKGDSLGFRV